MMTVLAVASALATGLAGGVFFAFSTFVMSGLRRLDPASAVAAMVAINRDAVRPPFMTLFAASFLVPVVSAVVAFVQDDAGAGLLIGAAVVAVVGVLGVTAVANVPLNERLERSEGRTAPGPAWTAYAARWRAWNHLRTLACALASVLAVLALA